MTNQLQRIIELEAENKRLRGAIKRSEDYSRNDNNPTAAHHALVMIEAISTQALSQPALTTGILELAVAGYLYARNKPDEEYDAIESFGRYTAIHRKIEALSPEVRQLLEDMA